MMKINTGDSFPTFILNDEKNTPFDLNSVLGKKNLVIYFYPKDGTLGCTKQACSFRDAYEDFNELDCEVIGISRDSSQSHTSFKNNHKLPFKLLSDIDGKVSESLGIPDLLFGLLPGRYTFVINKKCRIIKIFHSSINMTQHISEAIKALKNEKNFS